MKTDEIVIKKVNSWLGQEGKSYQWLADKLEISGSILEDMLSRGILLQPHLILQFSDLMNVQVKELLQIEGEEYGCLNVRVNGKISNRRSKRELSSLLFAIEDYVGMKNQL